MPGIFTWPSDWPSSDDRVSANDDANHSNLYSGSNCRQWKKFKTSETTVAKRGINITGAKLLRARTKVLVHQDIRYGPYQNTCMFLLVCHC